MGTTLTGTTPQDTYDSLIKVTDNGPLSGSLKKLTDGLGNDSSLSLSTTAASLSGTLAVTGATTLSSSLTANGLIKSTAAGAGFRHFYNNGAASIEVSQRSDSKLQLYAYTGSAYTDILLGVDGSTVGGNVGIGTSSPNIGGYVAGNTILTMAPSGVDRFSVLQLSGNRGFGGNQNGNIDFVNSEGTATITSRISGINSANALDGQIAFETRTSAGSLTERLRILSSGGITFNGDTAAANALDDYEEGTWTMGISFGGASVGVTYTANTGTYTKIGRQVTVNGNVILSSKGSSTGAALITGLPFASSSLASFRSASSLRFSSVSFANAFQAPNNPNTTTIALSQITEAGVDTVIDDTQFSNTSNIIVSMTYFV